MKKLQNGGKCVEGWKGSDFQSLVTRNNANKMHAINEAVGEYPTSSFEPLFM